MQQLTAGHIWLRLIRSRKIDKDDLRHNLFIIDSDTHTKTSLPQ